MFLSCSLFKPQKPDVYVVLSKRGTYPVHDDFKLYVKTAEQKSIEEFGTSFGKLVEIYYDDTTYLRKMNEETLEIKLEPIKYTEGPKFLYIFYREPINNILGIFASSGDANKISRIMGEVTRIPNQPFIQPLKNLRFALKEKENEINKIEEFGETVEVRITDIRDPHIADIWLKGSSVDQSVEYDKMIRDPAIGGTVEYMAITYLNKTYYLFSDGRLFTRQATDNIMQEIYPVYQITQKLHDVGAVQF